MNKQKLCLKHGKDLKKSKWKLVKRSICHLCKLENKFNKVLDTQELCTVDNFTTHIQLRFLTPNKMRN